MSGTLTADTVNQGLSYGALAAVVAGVPPEVALGSLAGAVIFVTSAVEYPIWRRVLLSLLSFLCGLLFYKPTASVLIGLASMSRQSLRILSRKGLFSLPVHLCQQSSLCELGSGSITVPIIHAS